MNRAVFLDRDGVINRSVVRDGKPYPPPTLAELEFLPGVAEALDRLHQANFRLVIVTNQPDVATGVQRKDVVEAIHDRIRQTFPIDEIKVCYHIDKDNCTCRKPKPGMLLAASEEGVINLTQSYLVGDRWRDIEAGLAAGCTTFWIQNNYAEREPQNPDFVVQSLLDATDIILTRAARGANL